jgi:hypothetical protein
MVYIPDSSSICSYDIIDHPDVSVMEQSIHLTPLQDYESAHIHVCPYEIYQNGSFPILRYLLCARMIGGKETPAGVDDKSPGKELSFVSYEEAMDALSTEDIVSHGLFFLTAFLPQVSDAATAEPQKQPVFKGFKVEDNHIYCFYDLTGCNCDQSIYDEHCNNTFWFVLMDEIINVGSVCGIPISNLVRYFFESNLKFCFLTDTASNDTLYFGIPIVVYVAREQSKLYFTHVFGVSPERLRDKYFLFDTYENAAATARKMDKYGIVRIALYVNKLHTVFRSTESSTFHREEMIEHLFFHNDMDAIYLESSKQYIAKSHQQQCALSYHFRF